MKNENLLKDENPKKVFDFFYIIEKYFESLYPKRIINKQTSIS